MLLSKGALAGFSANLVGHNEGTIIALKRGLQGSEMCSKSPRQRIANLKRWAHLSCKATTSSFW